MTTGDLQGRAVHDRSVELAATAIDFDLTTTESRELEAHLAGCPACVRRVTALRTDATRLGRTPSVLPSSRVDDAILAEIARQHRRPTRLTLAVAAGLLLIALLGAIAAGSALLRTWQTLPISVVPLPSTPVADVTSAPDASPVTAGDTWGTIAIPTSDIGNDWIGLMKAVALTETRYVAVGRPVCVPQNDPTTCHASAWTAGPGTGWTRAPAQPGLLVGTAFSTSGPEPGMLDVAAGPGGFVSIGYDSDPQVGGPAIWRSPDGRTWERVAFTFGASPAEASSRRVTAVGAGRDGYVIVGYTIAGFSTPAPAVTAQAAAWTSPDGVTWTPATAGPSMDVGPCQDTGEEPACGGMRAVVATGSGFVAVGQARTNGGTVSRPAAWMSADGLTWARSDAGLDFDGRLSGIARGGPGLVAVGTACRPDCTTGADEGIAVTSTDGATWDLEGAKGAAPFESVASTAGSTFALGVRNPDDVPGADLQLWRRTDAVRWERVTSLPSIPDATLYPDADIAATTDRLVIVGWAHTDGDVTFRNFSYTSPPAAAKGEQAPGPAPSAAASPSPSLSAPATGSGPRVAIWSMPSASQIDVASFQVGPPRGLTPMFTLDTWPDPDRSVEKVIDRRVLIGPDGRRVAVAETDPQATTRVRVLTDRGDVAWSIERPNGAPAMAWSADGTQLAIAFTAKPWLVVGFHGAGAPIEAEYPIRTAAPLRLVGFSADGLALLAFDSGGGAAAWERPYLIDLIGGTVTPTDRFGGGASGLAVSNTTTEAGLVDPVTGRVLDDGAASGDATTWSIRHGTDAIKLGVPISDPAATVQPMWADDGSIVVLETSLDNAPPSNEQKGSTLGVIRNPTAGARPGEEVPVTWSSMGPLGTRSRGVLLGVWKDWAVVGQNAAPARDDAWLGFDELSVVSLASSRFGLMHLDGVGKRDIHLAGLFG